MGEPAAAPRMHARGGQAVCGVCPHACAPAEGRRGLCRARVARGGQVVCESYGRVTSLALDPVEKKPLARWRPGSSRAVGRLLRLQPALPFCQNASFRCAARRRAVAGDGPRRAGRPRARGAGPRLRRRGLHVQRAARGHRVRGRHRAARARAGDGERAREQRHGQPGPLAGLVPLLDAANIDLKGFSQAFYDVAGRRLRGREAHHRHVGRGSACHLEVTTLVIPGLNDDEATIDAAAAWLARSTPPSRTTHALLPCHRMADRPPTPVGPTCTALPSARRHLGDVLLGNC